MFVEKPVFEDLIPEEEEEEESSLDDLEEFSDSDSDFSDYFPEDRPWEWDDCDEESEDESILR